MNILIGFSWFSVWRSSSFHWKTRFGVVFQCFSMFLHILVYSLLYSRYLVSSKFNGDLLKMIRWPVFMVIHFYQLFYLVSNRSSFRSLIELLSESITESTNKRIKKFEILICVLFLRPILDSIHFCLYIVYWKDHDFRIIIALFHGILYSFTSRSLVYHFSCTFCATFWFELWLQMHSNIIIKL